MEDLHGQTRAETSHNILLDKEGRAKGSAARIVELALYRGVAVVNILRVLWREAGSFGRVRIGIVLVLVAAGAVLIALSPVAFKVIVDDLANGGHVNRHSALVLVAFYVGSLWLARIAGELSRFFHARALQRLFHALGKTVFSHLMQLPLQFHLERRTGAVSQTLDSGLEGLRMVLQNLMFSCIPVVAELTTVVVVLVRTVAWPFVYLFCGALLSYGMAFAYSAARITKAARAASSARIDVTAMMTDSLLNYETVKYYTAEGLVKLRVGIALAHCEREWCCFHRMYTINGLAVAGIFTAFLAATVLYATKEVQRGGMTVGNFVLVNAYMLQFVRPAETLGYAVQGLSQGVAMLEKLMELLLERPEPPLMDSVRQYSGGPCALEFRDVSLSYDKSRRVLARLDLRIPAGCTVGIVGPSGSGKSSVVRLLMRLLEPESGTILLDGTPISRLSLAELRSAIAVVPQDTALFNETISYNIAFGRPDASANDIAQAARVAQLHDFIMTLPRGYETKVGERGIKLSGGERQRVSIARAVLRSPKVFVFDEATSSLDSETERGILSSLREISKFHTTLAIAHRLSTVLYAEEIVVLEKGRVAERGTHSSLLRENGRYAALWLAQHGDAVGA